MTDLRERPILFSVPMVRAILTGTKTQTRRVVKGQSPQWLKVWEEFDTDDRQFFIVGGPKEAKGYPIIGSIRCPYGAPGDHLWVRETCRAHELTDKEARDDTYGVMERQGLEIPPFGLDGVIYAADGTFREIANTREAADAWWTLNAYAGKRGATVPPIHMPRWASRITLELTDVRVERLQGDQRRGRDGRGRAALPSLDRRDLA